jgi:hypothetical protein
MSTNPIRHACVLFAACLLPGCGGGDSETAATSADPPSESVAAAPAAPSAPATGGGTPAASSSPSGTRIDPSTPDGMVREAIQAVRDNEFERIWDLMPSSFQKDANDLVKEFGNQVDAELWDKSFNLLDRYISTIIAKEDMVYQTPEAQAQFGQMKTMLNQVGMGANASGWLTQEKIRQLGAPMNDIALTLLKSDLSSTKKLKSFDGRAFCEKTLSPMVKDLRQFIKTLVREASQIEELKSNVQVQMMLAQADIDRFLANIKVSKESEEADMAVVVIEIMGNPVKQKLIRVDGKWVPDWLGLSFRENVGKIKTRIPEFAATINAKKEIVMPALEQFEPLVAALEKANTQEEFNTAYANFNAQAPQITASSMGLPGIPGIPGMGSQFGGGTVKVVPATIEFQGEVTDEQLGEAIGKLEALTDDPEKAISLPKRDFGQLLLEIHPVGNPQAFASSIQFAKRAEYDAERKVILLELEPPPAKPAETTESSEPGDN